MTLQSKKILICEDHQIVIDGLVSILKSHDDFYGIGTIVDGDKAIDFIRNNNPDIILLDLNLPNLNGLDILKEIRTFSTSIKVIILTMYNKQSIVKKVKQYGANGFLLKNCSSSDLLNAIDSVFNNPAFYIGKGVVNSVEENDGFVERIRLTQREKEIIKELIKGLNVPQIAENLFISPYTVETHKKNIFKKLNIHNSIDLITLVNEKSLI